ncbi:MAG: nucleoside 2-deoxyribosyltransferase, partial [Candidatus Paceibacterota bacterium]
MKIYFAGSIRGGRDDKDLYFEIIKLLGNYGEVLTEHIGDSNLSVSKEGDSGDRYIYNRDMIWLNEADIVIAEVTTPSLGVG